MNCSNKISHTIRWGDNLYQLSRYYHTTVPHILSGNPTIDPYNLKVGERIIICPGKQFITRGGSANPSACPSPVMQIALLNDMHQVWEQHVYWTRMLLISIAERLQDESYVADTLLENPSDIAGIFALYYPSDTARIIEQLLTEHLQIGGELITALRDGESEKAKVLKSRWYKNADEMADAFSSINPFYNREDVRKMLYEHLDLTTQEVAMRLAKNYPADIEAFHEVEKEALAMADYFSSGIMHQFPQMFHES